MRREVDPRIAVEEHAPVDRDAAGIGTQKTRDHVDDRGLAGARAAEQGRDAGAGGEADVEGEATAPRANVDGERHGARNLCRIQRARISEARSAAIESATDRIVRRKAAASPPGT